MANTAKFISGDGVEHEVSIDSIAFEIMSKDGAFTRTDLPIDEAGQVSEPTGTGPAELFAGDEQKPLSRMNNKLELLAEAEKRGLNLVPDEVTKAQIIAAIEAFDAEQVKVVVGGEQTKDNGEEQTES